MTRYQKLQSPKKTQEKKSIFSRVYNFLALVTIGIMLILVWVTMDQHVIANPKVKEQPIHHRKLLQKQHQILNKEILNEY